MKTTLDTNDFQNAANILDCELAVVQAVAQVESSGKGFLADGRLVIRFEGHKFREFSKKRFDKSHPTISHPFFPDGRFNKGVISDYKRFKIGMQLDQEAALRSCSLGLFQVMGFNFDVCGFDDVHAFWDDMKLGVDHQLLSFCRFCINKKLGDDLRDKRWADFAFGYNGADFKANKYGEKLKKAYKRFSTVA